MTLEVVDIEWDADGMDPQKDCGLPSRTFVTVPETITTAMRHEAVARRLHNQHGFNPVRFVIIENKTTRSPYVSGKDEGP